MLKIYCGQGDFAACISIAKPSKVQLDSMPGKKREWNNFKDNFKNAISKQTIGC